MTMIRFRDSLLGISLMCASILAGANALTIAGKPARDVFKDEGVVKLLKAVISGNASEAKRLVAGGVDVNSMGEGGATPLIWMLAAHDVTAIKMLLNVGADPNKFVLQGVGNTGFGPPVWMAAGGGQKEALQVMLEHGGNPNLVFGNDSLLMVAVSGQHLNCAKLLLQRGADINLSVGPMSALTETMLHSQFGDAIWVLNNGYTHDLLKGRRMLAIEEPRPGQEAMKAQALEIIDRLLAAQRER